jgi:F-type H+-transporting ATPase subunit b
MLDIHIGLLIFTAAILLALIYLLNNFLYQPLLGFIAKRDAVIQKDMDSIAENGGELDGFLSKANALISDAKAEAAKIRESAVNGAKEAASKELEAAQAVIESKQATFVQELKGERDGLKKELLSNLSTYQSALQSKMKKIG